VEGKLGERHGRILRGVDTRSAGPSPFKCSRAVHRRFERGARAISSLNQPNICTLYDIGPNYLVMELLEGDTLAAR